MKNRQNMNPVLGCIADDFTGATDLGSTLVKNGMRVVQLLGVPDGSTPIPEADAIIIALKSRTAPVQEAVNDSVAALKWLKAAKVRQFFFKYCSTFDSTPQGNIGPVAEALMVALGSEFTIACPAFPENGRTVFQGHLFVGATPLAESSMRNHPLTPMRDSNLVRFLGRQTDYPVDLVPFSAVEAGMETIRNRFTALQQEGKRIAIVDALTDAHLRDVGLACADMELITGGSGVAMELPSNFRAAGLLGEPDEAGEVPAVAGAEAVISGSCSPATLSQVSHMALNSPIFSIDPMEISNGRDLVSEALDWASAQRKNGRILFSASGAPEAVSAVQDRLGVAAAGELVESALSRIAVGLVERGVRRMVVAGGETSGAVVSALGVRGLHIGREITPGVPCTVSLGDPVMALALKSGNFGGPNFFNEALDAMP
jgi:3-dehydrotetronate 4-kinase